MKKQLLLFSFLILGSFLAQGQMLLNHELEQRNVILEDYSGVNCGYCPEGHVIAKNIKDLDPENVTIISIHAGSFANPGPGQPDFRTPYGNVFAQEMGVTAYPNATINRHTFNNGLALGRGQWRGASDNIKTFTSPVNVGFISEFDPISRELTVSVELYYVMDSPSSTNFIQVAFLENGYIGFQVDYVNGNDPNYVHNDILRELLTGQWGDEVTTTTAGTSVTREYTWTVPQEFDIENCDVAVYVSQNKREIFTGHSAKADGGSTIVIGKLESSSSSQYFSGQEAQTTMETMTITNNLPDTETYYLTIEEDGPADWSAQVKIDGVVSTEVTIEAGQSKDIALSIVPGSSVGVGSYTLTMSSSTYSGAPTLSKSIHIIAGVRDLIISNSTALPFEIYYFAGLSAAGNNAHYATSPEVMMGFQNANALSDVNNIYFNIGWTFPGLTDATVIALSAFLDNGGNLFIAGQDIGWDTYDPAGNGTSVTKDFYSNYLNAQYLSDGSSANNTINSVDSDDVFANIPSSPINDIYGGGNIYPEELAPLNGAQPIFTYGSGSKVGAVRFDNGVFKVVYLGFNFEQLTNIETGLKIAKRAHNWFYDLTTGVNDVISDLSIALYPNPASNNISLELENALENPTILNIYAMDGKKQLENRLSKGIYRTDINTSSLESGIYIVELVNANKGVLARTKISIVK